MARGVNLGTGCVTVKIANNLIDTFTGDGVLINGSTDCQIENNRIMNANAATAYGIRVTGTTSAALYVAGNVIDDTVDGVHITTDLGTATLSAIPLGTINLTAVPAPEPATCGLLGLGALLLAVRRRR